MPVERLSASGASLGSVLAKADYFSSVTLWPHISKLDPRAWLANFDESEKKFAVALLNSFTYYSAPMTRALFVSVFHCLSTSRKLPGNPDKPIRDRWDDFKSSLILTYVEGESPNPTDSGFIFTRMARQELGIAQSQIVTPERAMRILASENGRPIVFVDDFLGSGDQMTTTWQRKHEIAAGQQFSFADISATVSTPVFYIPLISTEIGHQAVEALAGQLEVIAAHRLDERESLLHPDSVIWPAEIKEEASAFLESASRRAGIPADKWRGYKDAGLAIAFEHSVPDATLPLIHHESATWHPLIRRG